MDTRGRCCRSIFCRTPLFYLALVCCFALATGVCIAFGSQHVVSSMMYAATKCRSSIVGLGFVVLIPLLIAFSVTAFSVPGIIYFVAFIDCISSTFCFVSAICTFGTAGWLIFVLLSFSQTTLVVLRVWFYTQCLVRRDDLFRIFVYVLAISALVFSVDYCFASRFLLKLMIDL